MNKSRYMRLKLFIPAFATLLGAVSCTKLEQKLQSSIVFDPNSTTGSVSATALLTGTYNDLNGLLNNQDQIFSLEENTSAECLVPTRAGDWDDNVEWRVLHAHPWTSTHAQFQCAFNGLEKTQ